MSEQKKVFIDRDHFDERVRLAAGPDADEEFDADFLDGVKVVLHMLSTETPADVKPVVRGTWVWNTYTGRYHCSRCAGLAPILWDGDDEYINTSDFCSNCGADMRKEKDDE